jgi:methionine-gamma-lyase
MRDDIGAGGAPSTQTWLTHGDRHVQSSSAVAPPVYQTAMFAMTTPAEYAEASGSIAPTEFYTRYGSPTLRQVEVLLAGLEGGEAALAVGSGMAAISAALLSTLRAGDHVVAQRTHYTGTLSLFLETLPRLGIDVSLVDQTDAGAFAAAVRPGRTKVIYTETPTNPTLALTDLRATAAIAHGAGALAITDNTFATPYNQRPIEFGYDLVAHSATKYLNGHSDVTAGVLVGRRELIDQAWGYLRTLGPVLHPWEAWLLLRGLRTFGLRMAAHNAGGLRLAEFLAGHPAVTVVHFPGLASHPQHELARAQMPGGFSGMLSFEAAGGFEAAYRLVERTRVCLPAVSLGGVHTLITHPASMMFSHQTPEQIAAAGVTPELVRISVGIEDPADLIADLDQALAQPAPAAR